MDAAVPQRAGALLMAAQADRIVLSRRAAVVVRAERDDAADAASAAEPYVLGARTVAALALHLALLLQPPHQRALEQVRLAGMAAQADLGADIFCLAHRAMRDRLVGLRIGAHGAVGMVARPPQRIEQAAGLRHLDRALERGRRCRVELLRVTAKRRQGLVRIWRCRLGRRAETQQETGEGSRGRKHDQFAVEFGARLTPSLNASTDATIAQTLHAGTPQRPKVYVVFMGENPSFFGAASEFDGVLVTI